MNLRALGILAACVIAGPAFGGAVEDAQYLHWTQQDEAAAAVLEPWLSEHPDDLAAHRLYLEVRVTGMGELDVVRAEYDGWSAPTPELKAQVDEALDNLAHGDPADPEYRPFPKLINKRWVKHLTRAWTDDPYALRAAVPILWGLDAPIGQLGDTLRTEALRLASEGVKSDDPLWVEAGRAAAEAGDVPGLALVGLQRLAEIDAGAWPGALDETGLRKVRRASQAFSRNVALSRLDSLELPKQAIEAQKLRHSLRAELYEELEQPEPARQARRKAWEVDPSDAENAILFAEACLDAGRDLDVAARAIQGGIQAAEKRTWVPLDAVEGLSWPEAWALFYMDRRVAMGRLNTLRKAVDRVSKTQSPKAPKVATYPDAAFHLAAAAGRDDRVGTRHLVQAVRLARREGNADMEAKAKAAIDARKAWFPGGLDARISGWDASLGEPNDLRPMAGRRPGALLDGQPLTDFQIEIDGAKLRISELEGARVLATFQPGCPDCTEFMRSFDKISRELQGDPTRYIAVDVSGNDRRVEKFFEDAELNIEVAHTSGELPDDVTRAGVPRVFVIGPKGVVARDSGASPDEDELRSTVRDALVEVGLLIETGDAPPSIYQHQPRYPLAAHWLGTPQAECLGQVVLAPNGQPFHVSVHDCAEPFITATRKALDRWRFEPRDVMSEGLVTVSFGQPEPKYSELPPAECLYWTRVRQNGELYNEVSTCDSTAVHPGPVPWSEPAVAGDTQLNTAAGSVMIRNVRLATSCEVALDVGKNTIDVSVDSGTCPDSVRSDALERVRRWDWDVGIGRDVPLRVVLRFDPPRR